MALVKCQECGKDVSSEAGACPHCGYPRSVKPPPLPKAPSNYVPGWMVLLTFVCLGIFIWWKATDGGTESATVATPAKPPQTQADKDRDYGMALVGIAVTSVKSSLKDADSAKFRNVFAIKTKSGEYIACGEVNARNSFGGYTGFKPFVTQGDAVRVQSADDPNAVIRRWNATCAKAPTVYQSHRND